MTDREHLPFVGHSRPAWSAPGSVAHGLHLPVGGRAGRALVEG